MDEEVINFVELPLDKIPTKSYSFHVKIPTKPEIPENIEDREKSLKLITSPDYLVRKITDIITSNWEKSNSANKRIFLPEPLKRDLRTFFWRNYSVIMKAKKPELSVKFLDSTGESEITLTENVNGSEIAFQSTKCTQITCQNVDIKNIDRGNLGKMVYALFTYKKTLVVDGLKNTWLASSNKSLRFDDETFQTIFSEAKPISPEIETIEELAIKADKFDCRIVPKYINGIRFIDGSVKKLELGNSSIDFDKNNKKETGIAKVLLGEKNLNLYGVITFEEIHDKLYADTEDPTSDWFSASKATRAKREKEIKNRAYQLGKRIANFVGASESVILSTPEGLIFNPKYLKPRD